LQDCRPWIARDFTIGIQGRKTPTGAQFLENMTGANAQAMEAQNQWE
jgi:hypothetical protein